MSTILVYIETADCKFMKKIPRINLQKNFITSTGERYCLLVDTQSGLPLYYPNLFVATQVRNKSLSLSAMEATLGGINILLRFMLERDEVLEDRFRQHQFFEIHELDSIRDFCQIKFRVRTLTAGSNEMFTLEELQSCGEKVGLQTEYVRLTTISHYVKWLAELLSGVSREKNTALRIKAMADGIIERRPERKNRNSGLVEKGLTEKQIGMLFELFRPESELNPFNDKAVKVRNRLIFLLLYHLGLRSGELLNIRIKDINFTQNQIVVFRRADEKDDPRIDQGLVKTKDRRLPMKETLVKEIHNYIINFRKKVVRPGQPDYLFVVHKEGPTRGQAISKSTYKKVIVIVRKVSYVLYGMTGHKLRHTWNEQFSILMDSMDNPPSAVAQEEMRSNLMGWKPGSGTASIYNNRFTARKAQAAGLEMQEGMVRLPKEMKHE